MSKFLDILHKYISNRETHLIYKKEINQDQTHSPDTNFELDTLDVDDQEFFFQSEHSGANDWTMLANADFCFIARSSDVPVHHTCIAVDSPFEHPRQNHRIRLEENEAFIYGVETDIDYRGKGIAPAAYKYAESYLLDEDIDTIYTYIAKENLPSIRSFEKAGFIYSGQLRHIRLFGKNLIVNKGHQLYAEEPIFSLRSMSIYREVDEKISQSVDQLRPLLQKWQSNRMRVVIFGAGSHTRSLFNQEKFLVDQIDYILDDDMTKQGKSFHHWNISVKPAKTITETQPDIILISSQAYQHKMINRIRKLIQNNLDNCVKLVKLYPEMEIVTINCDE